MRLTITAMGNSNRQREKVSNQQLTSWEMTILQGRCSNEMDFGLEQRTRFYYILSGECACFTVVVVCLFVCLFSIFCPAFGKTGEGGEDALGPWWDIVWGPAFFAEKKSAEAVGPG